MPRTSEPGRSVSSRLLEILFAFRRGRGQMTLAALVRHTGLPYATVRRLVTELLAAGALERTPDGNLTVGLRLWELGTLAPLSVPLRTVALPFLEDLYTALQQHVQLAVLEGREAVVIERLSAPRAVGLVSEGVGGRLPLHSSGVGKVLLAHGGDELLEAILSGRLARYTPQTLTDPVRLRRQLAECRRTGAANVREELTVGADSVAARIMNADGRVVAALSVVVRSGSLQLQRVTPSLLSSGLGISRRLGWTPQVGVRAGLPASAASHRGSGGTGRKGKSSPQVSADSARVR